MHQVSHPHWSKLLISHNKPWMKILCSYIAVKQRKKTSTNYTKILKSLNHSRILICLTVVSLASNHFLPYRGNKTICGVFSFRPPVNKQCALSPVSAPSVYGVSFLKMIELVGLFPWNTWRKQRSVLFPPPSVSSLDSTVYLCPPGHSDAPLQWS